MKDYVEKALGVIGGIVGLILIVIFINVLMDVGITIGRAWEQYIVRTKFVDLALIVLIVLLVISWIVDSIQSCWSRHESRQKKEGDNKRSE